MSYVDFLFFKKTSTLQENSLFNKLEICPYSNCTAFVNQCNPSLQCSTDTNRRICASNLQEYFNECEMNKYACQSQISLTKLHDGPSDYHEQHQQWQGKKNIKSCLLVHV